MTLNAYLVHPIVLTVIYGQVQKTIHITDITMATFTVAIVVFSYAVAGVVCLCVEFPLGSVEMLLFKMVGLEGKESQRQGPDCKENERLAELVITNEACHQGEGEDDKQNQPGKEGELVISNGTCQEEKEEDTEQNETCKGVNETCAEKEE